MALSGPSAFSAAASDPTLPAGSTMDWTNPSNALVPAETPSVAYAQSTGSGGETSRYLKLTNASALSIPSTATILGIVVHIDKMATFALTNTGGGGTLPDRYYQDAEVRILVGGSPAGQNKAQAGAWSDVDFVRSTYGASNDAWTLSLTGANINSGFGIALSGAAISEDGSNVAGRIDYAQITVYYASAAGTRRRAEITLS